MSGDVHLHTPASSADTGGDIGQLCESSIERERREFSTASKLFGYRIKRDCAKLYERQPGLQWISDIIPSATREATQTILDNIERGIATGEGNNRNPTKSICLVWHPEAKVQQTTEGCFETGHIHLYHACNYNQSRCQCAFVRAIPQYIKRRRSRDHSLLNSLKNDYWTNWLKYFLQEPREILLFQIGRVSYRSQIHRLKNLRQSSIDARDQTDGTVEDCFFPREIINRSKRQFSQDNGENSASSQCTESTYDGRYTDLSGLGLIPRRALKNKVTDHDNLLRNLRIILCVPIESTCQTSLWTTNPILRYYNNSDTDYKRACSSFNREIQYLDFHQLHQIHMQTKGCYFARTENHYYEPEESASYLEKLLFHQYSDLENVTAFLNRLWSICEKKIPKKNAMFVVGAASAGKTWFFDAITAYYLSIGHVKNFVRGQNFPLNDCVCRRILMWNEPSIMGSAYDSVKMLCAGDPCPGAVKYEGDGKIMRTPLIFTSNKNIFPQSDIWTSRIYFEPKWRAAPFLQSLTKYPHPLSWAILVNKYILN